MWRLSCRRETVQQNLRVWPGIQDWPAVDDPTIAHAPLSSLPELSTNTSLPVYSLMVCEKVLARGTTTYNEVADSLVQDFMAGNVRGEQAVRDGRRGWVGGGAAGGAGLQLPTSPRQSATARPVSQTWLDPNLGCRGLRRRDRREEHPEASV